LIRGDLVTIALPRDFSKPRPALVIQSHFFEQIDTLTVALITSAIIDAPYMRVTVVPTAQNGLKAISQVMVDKVMTSRTERIGAVFGRLETEIMLEVDRRLALFLGIAR
jgi:mRNA interferase MazF